MIGFLWVLSTIPGATPEFRPARGASYGEFRPEGDFGASYGVLLYHGGFCDAMPCDAILRKSGRGRRQYGGLRN